MKLRLKNEINLVTVIFTSLPRRGRALTCSRGWEPIHNILSSLSGSMQCVDYLHRAHTITINLPSGWRAFFIKLQEHRSIYRVFYMLRAIENKGQRLDELLYCKYYAR